MTDTILMSKLETLKRCLDRIQSKVPSNNAILHSDWDIQDIISLNLQRAVQSCVDIASHLNAVFDQPAPMNMADGFILLEKAGVICAHTSERMIKSVGFRNVMVHSYDTVAWDIVYSILKKHIQDFESFAIEIHEWMEQQNQQD